MKYAAPGFPEFHQRRKLKRLTPEMLQVIASEVKAILHAHRDSLRNRYLSQIHDDSRSVTNIELQGLSAGKAKNLRSALATATSRIDPRTLRMDGHDGYYGEAFGMMRTLQSLGYGRFASSNIPGSDSYHGFEQDEQNLKWWFNKLKQEVLEEENFGGSGECTYCRNKWQKDDSTLP